MHSNPSNAPSTPHHPPQHAAAVDHPSEEHPSSHMRSESSPHNASLGASSITPPRRTENLTPNLILETYLEDEPDFGRFHEAMTSGDQHENTDHAPFQEMPPPPPPHGRKKKKKRVRTHHQRTVSASGNDASQKHIVSYQAGAHPSAMIAASPPPTRTSLTGNEPQQTHEPISPQESSTTSPEDEERNLLYPHQIHLRPEDTAPIQQPVEYTKSPLVPSSQQKDMDRDTEDSRNSSISSKKKKSFFQRLLSSRALSQHKKNAQKLVHPRHVLNATNQGQRFSQTDTESLSGEPPQNQVPLRIRVHLKKGEFVTFDNVDDLHDYLQQFAQDQQERETLQNKKRSSLNQAPAESESNSTASSSRAPASSTSLFDTTKNHHTTSIPESTSSKTVGNTSEAVKSTISDKVMKPSKSAMHTSASAGNLLNVEKKSKKKARNIKVDARQHSAADASIPRPGMSNSNSKRNMVGMRRTQSSDNLSSSATDVSSPSSGSSFDVLTFNNDQPPIWIDIQAPDSSDMDVLGDLFALHPLTVEDCLNPAESGDKYEVMQDIQHKSIYLFLVVKNVSDTLNIIIFKNFVITIHLKNIPVLDKVQNRLEVEYQREILLAQANGDKRRNKRLRDESSLISSSSFQNVPTVTGFPVIGAPAAPKHRNKRRKKKVQNKLYSQQSSNGPCFMPSPSHIAYLYFDQIVDHFLSVSRQKLLHVDDEENVIMQLGTDDMDDALLRLNIIRRETRMLRRYLFPKKNIIYDLMNLDRIPFLCSATKIGLRDVYDHLNSAVENLEEEMTELNAIQARYLMKMNAEAAANNNRMVQMAARHDQQLGRLTIITGIFSPLSLLAGIFGMNTWVPGTVTPLSEVELRSYLWFSGVMLIMLCVACAMGTCFRDQLFSFARPHPR
eukprot:CAMPEP_0117450956 /NCGR_PEP_ID=MMETSP0759-20121206/8749_1 /TAXON_ID=63605 /ORGANISM="Percolomonas cosmopolitus, Strain WS" /LENGTH=895 /DNA_ID=CAMNT_0005243521 /DNA_START=160 /DNA_END=2843 /DNA_ORIENTATION=+